jgi:hypothetical protein
MNSDTKWSIIKRTDVEGTTFYELHHHEAGMVKGFPRLWQLREFIQNTDWIEGEGPTGNLVISSELFWELASEPYGS